MIAKAKNRRSRGPERRRAPRARAKLPLEITRDKKVIEGLTRDISSSGAYCTFNRFIPLNTKLNVTLLLPEKDKVARGRSKKVTCHGLVVRNEPISKGKKPAGYGIALCFTDLTIGDRRRIAYYVERKLPREAREILAMGKGASGKYDPGEVFHTGLRGKGNMRISSANFKVFGEDISISRNGICCRTDRSIPLFREIAVNLVLPPPCAGRGKKKAEAVQCSAIVVGCEKVPRTRNYTMAAYFVGLTDAQKERLEDCIKNVV